MKNKAKKRTRRIISVLLTVIMVMSIIPFATISTSAASDEGWYRPVDSRYWNLTDYFGWRKWTESYHYGIDISAGGIGGAPIRATRSGVVSVATYNSSCGNYVVVSHGNGYSSIYMHMRSTPSVKVGQQVRQGAVLGYVGTTGFSTGNHLHFGVCTGSYWSNSRAINPLTLSYKDSLTIPKPSAPTLTLSSASSIAVGGIATVTWSAVANATEYTVNLIDTATNTVVDTKRAASNATRADFTVKNLGNYKITAVAKNSSGSSSTATCPTTVTTKAPLTVTFEDYNGEVLSIQTVPYGSSATAPQSPEREHYVFNSWSKSYSNITADSVITAIYRPQVYTVKFYNFKNSAYTLISQQQVEYLKSATAPALTPAEGYTLAGWDKDFSSVTDNMNIYCNESWYNNNMSVFINNMTAQRDSDGNGYTITLKVVNNGTAVTSGRVIAAIKTSEDKLVETTESSAFSIKAGATKTLEIFVPSNEVATVAECFVVEKFSSAIPISNTEQKAIDQNGEWSEWSTDAPPANATDTETQTQYRYRTKSTVTSGYDSLSGYTKYDTTTSSSTASSYSSSKPSSSVAYTSNSKLTYTYSTAYLYSCYGWKHDGTDDWTYMFEQNKSTLLSRARKYYPNRSDAQLLAQLRYFWKVDSAYSSPNYYYTGTVNYKNENGSTGTHYVVNTRYWYEGTRYLITTKTTKNYFYKWSDWSDWSTTAVTGTSDKEVETRTLYRYKDNNVSGLEKTTGVARTVSGNVDTSFAGREATLFIYKVNEASDFTNEYVGQTTIGADGSYSFNFKLREEPTVETGDYTVTLGIEGTTAAIHLDSIIAPVPSYSVNFVDWDGTIIDRQTVNEGDNAAIPESVPSRTGYTFTGWSTNTTNIKCDTVVYASYKIDSLSVVFVDWERKTVDVKTFDYGSELICPEVSDLESKYFTGWDKAIEGLTSVTENLVLTAVYETKTFSAEIYDWHNTLIDTQTISYGDSIELPEELSEDGYIFNNWKCDDNMFNVTKDIVVTPDFKYVDTVETPTASIVSGEYSAAQTVTLATETAGATVYYTLDGSNPLNKGIIYTGPITISASTNLRFAAAKQKMNPSEIVDRFFAINPTVKMSACVPYSSLPQKIVNNPSAYNLTFAGTGYRYKNIYTTTSLVEAQNFANSGMTLISSEFGAYSDWAKELPSLSDCEYESEFKEAEAIPTAMFKYSHWKYFDETQNKYVYTINEVDGKDCVYESFTIETNLGVSSFVNENPAYSYNDQLWFSQTPVTVNVPANFKYYRYRVKTFTYFAMSDWTTEAPAANETREYESTNVYKYTVPDDYIVNIHYVDANGSPLTKTIITEKGSNITVDESIFEVEGYTYGGLYTDSTYYTEWSSSSAVTESLNLYAKQTPVTFNVRFLDYDGTVIDSQRVRYLETATIPDEPTRENYVFTGWGNSLDAVSSDIDYVAQYVAEADYVRVALSRSKVSLMTGSSYKLGVVVTPDSAIDSDVMWYSSNTAVATVDEFGNVTAVHSGSAIITVVSLETFETSNCAVTVLGTADTEILPISNSGVIVDSSAKFLLGIDSEENTIDKINDKLQNPDLVYTDRNGNHFGSGDHNRRLGTGCRIVLFDNGTIIDRVEIVINCDINGDGVVDALDAYDTERIINNHKSITGAFKRAADAVFDDIIDMNDYSSIVNKALS